MSDSAYPLNQAHDLPAGEIAEAWQWECPGAPVESIGMITPLWRVAKLLADERRRTLQRLGVDPATLDLLSTLRRAGKPYRLTTRELAARCLVTTGAISQRVSRAEHAGLATRARAQDGSRAVTVTLTQVGHRLIESAVEKLLAHEQELLPAMTAQQRDDFAQLLEEWYRKLRERVTDS